MHMTVVMKSTCMMYSRYITTQVLNIRITYVGYDPDKYDVQQITQHRYSTLG